MKEQESTIASLNRRIEDFDTRIKEYQKLDDRNSNLNARENAVSELEKNLQISSLKYQLEVEKEKTQFSKDVALGLVRNSEYRKTVFDSATEPFRDNYGGTQYGTRTNNTTEDNTTK